MTEQDVEKKADTEGSGDTDNRIEVKGIAWKDFGGASMVSIRLNYPRRVSDSSKLIPSSVASLSWPGLDNNYKIR